MRDYFYFGGFALSKSRYLYNNMFYALLNTSVKKGKMFHK